MTGTEKELTNLKAELESLLSEKYKSVIFKNDKYKGEKMFIGHTGKAVHIDIIAGYKCLVIEHAETAEEAERLTLEDGDLFYPEEFLSKNDLFKAMMNEIEE